MMTTHTPEPVEPEEPSLAKDLLPTLRAALAAENVALSDESLIAFALKIEKHLAPESSLLVRFPIFTDTWSEGWESSIPDYEISDLDEPKILAYNTTDGERARLLYSIETYGSLSEGESYSTLDHQISEFGTAAHERLAQKRAAEHAQLAAQFPSLFDPEQRR